VRTFIWCQLVATFLAGLGPATGCVVKTTEGFEKPHLHQRDVDREINRLYEALATSKKHADEHGWDANHETGLQACVAMRRTFSILGVLDRYHFKADPPLRAADVPGYPTHGGADGMYEVHGEPPFNGYLSYDGEADCWPIDLVLAYGHAGLVQMMLDDFESSSGRCAGQDATWAPCCTCAWYTPSKCAASLIEREGHESLLHMVAEFGRSDLVPVLLRHCPDDTWFDPNQHGAAMYETPLHRAVRGNRPAVIRALLHDPRLHPNCICSNTPLHEAIAFGHEEATAALLDDPRVDIVRALEKFGPCTDNGPMRLARRRLVERREQECMAEEACKRDRDGGDGDRDARRQRTR